jgi:hypothetical protein
LVIIAEWDVRVRVPAVRRPPPRSSPQSECVAGSLGLGIWTASGRLQEALEQFDTALRLSPRDPGLWSYLTLKASTLCRLRRYDETVRFAHDAIGHSTADPIWPYVHLAAALGQLGRIDEALVAVLENRRRAPGLSISAWRAWPHNRSRSKRSLEHILDGMRLAGLPEQGMPPDRALSKPLRPRRCLFRLPSAAHPGIPGYSGKDHRTSSRDPSQPVTSRSRCASGNAGSRYAGRLGLPLGVVRLRIYFWQWSSCGTSGLERHLRLRVRCKRTLEMETSCRKFRF